MEYWRNGILGCWKKDINAIHYSNTPKSTNVESTHRGIFFSGYRTFLFPRMRFIVRLHQPVDAYVGIFLGC